MKTGTRNKLEDKILSRITKGEFVFGSILPSIRDLAKYYDVSTKTVHKALLYLVDEDVLEVKRGAGFKVIYQGGQENLVFAFLVRMHNDKNVMSLPVSSANEALQKEDELRGWSIILIPVDKMPITQLRELLHSYKVSGVILNEVDLRYREEIKNLGIPAVTLDAWYQYSSFCEVTRDEYQGAYIGAEYCVNKGLKEFAWYGPLVDNANAIARFGAISGLLRQYDLTFNEKMIYDCGKSNLDVRELLKQIKKPTAIFCFWKEALLDLMTALKDSGLKIGKDIEIVRWSTVEDYKYNFGSIDKKLNDKCVTVLWSVKEVAYNALNQFEVMILKNNTRPFRVCLPMKLEVPSAKGSLV